jgi:hypothetical protein
MDHTASERQLDHQALRQRIELRIEKIRGMAEAFPWACREAYPMYMRQVFEFSQHSPDLLALAGVRSKGDLKWRFFTHVKEEERHEFAAKKDVEDLGFDFDDVGVLSTTKAFVRSQYWVVEHQNPKAFYGYVMLLETLAVECGPIAYETAKSAFGQRCVKFLQEHIEEDEGHVESGWRQIEQMPTKDLQDIIENFEMSADLFCQILNGCRSFPLEVGEDFLVDIRQL